MGRYSRDVRRFVITAAAVLSLSACGADGTSSQGNPGGTVSGDSSPTRLSADTYTLVDGSSVNLAELRAEKPVALWFWAPG